MAVPGGPRSRVFRPPLVDPEEPVRETPSTSFADLVRMLAEGIADAQASLDQASAEMVVELAKSKVKIIPTVTETIDEAGNQFSEAKLDVAMDLKIVENETESGDQKRRYSLFAETANIRFERKLRRDVTVASKFSATMVPVPKPLRIGAERVTTTKDNQ